MLQVNDGVETDGRENIIPFLRRTIASNSGS